MSEEMAVGDTTCNEDAKVNGEEAVADAVKDESTSSQQPSDSPHPESTKSPQPEEDIKAEVKIELETMEDGVQDVAVTRGIKRRASSAFSEDGEFHGFVDGAVPEEEFKGFDSTDDNKLSIDYGRILERLEAEVSAAAASFTPLRNVQATALLRASKRPRTDTDGSRPSSALSSRSDGDGALSTEATSASTSPLPRRRATTEMSSPLLRLPLAAGWRRELVHRATFDSHNRRQADIYYYTPQGKKLRSTREVGEHLYGTGFTLENFSFFKEPLGIDDPEKEIIRDAKMQRTRVESPVPPPPAEGKRTPKPKPPKGASPEPATPKSPPPKIRVKSLGSRLSAGAAAKPTPKKPANDNNNTATWKKPRAPAAVPTAPVTTAVTTPVVTAPVVTAPVVTAPVMPSAPPPLQSRPHPLQQHVDKPSPSPMAPLQPRGVPQPPSLSPSAPPAPPAGHPPGTAYLQPCSLQCGRGVPTLACTACLCLYHPVCARADTAQDDFVCRNCRKSSSPPLEPPPLLHKSASGPPSVPRRNAPVPVPIPVPVPVPVPAKVRPDKRVLLRMKVSGGNPDGSRVWAVARPTPAAPATSTTPSRPPPTRPPHPQSLALLNGRRFIVVPRNAAGSGSNHESRTRPGPRVERRVEPARGAPAAIATNESRSSTRGRVSNGASSPPEALSPRRRGRPRLDDADHFTPFCTTAAQRNYNVALQIFQYVGMRDLAVCARVGKLWRALAETPELWRHVRMKNSHVRDWAGLCAALRRHATQRLDLRKTLLPPDDVTYWLQFAQHIPSVDTLQRLDMCRCPASAVEAACHGLPNLRALSAVSIRDAQLDPAPLGALTLLHELRLKSMAGLSLTRDLRPLAALTHLQHLSLTSIKNRPRPGSPQEANWCLSSVIGQLERLESLELGECSFLAEFADALRKLRRLRRLRLERGTAQCAAPALLRALATLPHLASLELVNVDIKVGFDDALAECRNIQRLLIIPTYVSQSATTNQQVLSGVLRLRDTLSHLMWGVTIELLRVTELFIDQCERAGAPRRDLGECIPVLKPVPGCRLPHDQRPRPGAAGPPQVEILPLPTLQRLLSAQLPNTKLKLLRIPFHATWRQSLADFQ